MEIFELIIDNPVYAREASELLLRAGITVMPDANEVILHVDGTKLKLAEDIMKLHNISFTWSEFPPTEW